LIAQLLESLNSTQGQVTASTDINPLLELVTDCLRFVTDFFEVISQSAPHIYHSALQLAPRSSIIWRLYNQQIGSLTARIVTGVSSSWDSCTASTGAGPNCCCVWSPCGKFIATGSVGSVTIQDSNTLERLSTLKSHEASKIESLAYSPDGCLLAGTYSSAEALR